MIGQAVKREATFHAATSSEFSAQTIFPPTMVATALPLSFQPKNGLFFDLLADFSGVKIHSASGSKTVTSASAPTLNVPLGRLSNRAGVHGVFGDRVRQQKPLRVDKLHQRQRQFGFQSGDAERRVVKLNFLFKIAVRRVVAAQNFNRAVGQPFQNRLAVARRTQRRVHFEIRVVGRPFGKFILSIRPGFSRRWPRICRCRPPPHR